MVVRMASQVPLVDYLTRNAATTAYEKAGIGPDANQTECLPPGAARTSVSRPPGGSRNTRLAELGEEGLDGVGWGLAGVVLAHVGEAIAALQPQR